MKLKPLTDPRPTRVIRLLLALIFAAYAASKGAEAAEKKPKARAARSAEADRLFASTEVPRIKIQIPEAELDKLRRQRPNFREQAERPVVKVTVTDGTTVYTNVSLQLKGAAGSFRPVDDNPAMTLNFDKFVPGQTFHGLDKLSLNNSVQDPTFLSEQFSREMFNTAGVPAPRATHVHVTLNGRDLGLYGLVEGWNKNFLARHFKNTKGNLYDGGFLKDITDELSVNSGDNPQDQSDRKALAAAAEESNPQVRAEKLDKVLDVERFISFIAMDILLWDWDGYALNRNNWRLFHDLDKGKMVFMPHGLDQMLWSPDGPALPRMKGLVARAVVGVPAFRTRYFERLRTLRSTVFQFEPMTHRVREIAAKIRPVIAEGGLDAAKQHDLRVEEFCRALARRCQSLDDQLARPIEPLKLDADGSAKLASWDSRKVFGKPVLDKVELDGTPTLRLGADGSSIGAWRTKVWLETGLYRFETRVRAKKIVADLGDSRSGTMISAEGSRQNEPITEASEWKSIQQEFNVPDVLSEIQISCEFRGMEGEAWYDLNAMKIRRIGDAKPEPRQQRRRRP